jgi:hypothetical protein
MIEPPIGATRAIITVARFRDGSRRVKACADVEEARRFVAGEGLTIGRRPRLEPIGQGLEESRRDVYYRSDDELLEHLRAAIL